MDSLDLTLRPNIHGERAYVLGFIQPDGGNPYNRGAGSAIGKAAWWETGRHDRLAGNPPRWIRPEVRGFADAVRAGIVRPQLTIIRGAA